MLSIKFFIKHKPNHLFFYHLTPLIKFDLYAKGTVLYLQGIDKKVLSSFAKSIQNFRPPEPYKGKGVLFNDEIIRRKEGKKK